VLDLHVGASCPQLFVRQEAGRPRRLPGQPLRRHIAAPARARLARRQVEGQRMLKDATFDPRKILDRLGVPAEISAVATVVPGSADRAAGMRPARPSIATAAPRLPRRPATCPRCIEAASQLFTIGAGCPAQARPVRASSRQPVQKIQAGSRLADHVGSRKITQGPWAKCRKVIGHLRLRRRTRPALYGLTWPASGKITG